MQNPDSERPAPAVRRRPRRLWLIVVLLLVIALVAFLVLRGRNHGAAGRAGHGGHGGRGGHGATAMANVAQPVRVARATRAEVPIVKYALGTVTPLATVTVRSRIAGELLSLGFTEGQHVKRGDVLAQIDPRPTQAALAQSEGNLLRDQALLEQARRDLERYRVLLAQDSVARQTYDDQISLVKQREGTVKTDRGAVAANRLDLQYARITSPIDGRAGLRQVDVGNYVQTGDTNGIVVVTQTAPISVLFTLPEDDVNQVMARVRAGATLSASAYDRANARQLALGRLVSVDNQIDTSTGTVRLRANFENRDDGLFPNQFVNVHLLVDTLRDVIVIPATAIQTGSIGSFVYLVKSDNTVTVRKVKTGQTDAERVVVTEGLNDGDTVVVDGVDRLREGAKITVPNGAAGTSRPASATAAASGSASAAAVHGQRPGAAAARPAS